MRNLSEAAALVGLKQPTLTKWIKAGLIQIPGHKGKQWSPVLFGPKELHELKILVSLRGLLSLQAIRRAAEYLRSKGDNPYSRGEFVVLAGRSGHRELIRIETNGEAVNLLEHPGQLLLRLPDLAGDAG